VVHTPNSEAPHERCLTERAHYCDTDHNTTDSMQDINTIVASIFSFTF